MRLTKEDILRIPELSKSMSITQMAGELKVSKRAIDYWIAKLKAKGYEISTKRGGYNKIEL